MSSTEVYKGAAASLSADYEDGRWLGFLSRWSLLAGLVFLGLLLAFFVWILSASQGSSLPQDYFEFAAAMKSPALYRIAITFDVAGWCMLGGFFIALAAIFVRRAPVRGTLIAACGVGQVVGMTGVFLRLKGTSALDARYTAADPGQREPCSALIRSLSRSSPPDSTPGPAGWPPSLLSPASSKCRRVSFKS